MKEPIQEMIESKSNKGRNQMQHNLTKQKVMKKLDKIELKLLNQIPGLLTNFIYSVYI